MVQPKKHLGQHFLRDENIARKIVGLMDPDSGVVLEIGPGTGVLSKYLLEIPGIDPWFMDVDRESVEYLKGTYPEFADRFILADFLRTDLAGFPPAHEATKEQVREGTLFQSHHPAISPCRNFSTIGNFPYNISTQILFRVLEFRNRIPEVTGMFQKEVAERIAAPPGSKTYGILSVLMQAFYNIEYLFTVNETVFFPPPKVKSAVIRLRRNSTPKLDCDESLFFRVVKTAFNQRRKTLRNSLSSLGIAGLGEFAGCRPEQLGVAEFVSLTKLFIPLQHQ
jgi:16S rRNA (adenine1518-N6/adenine1519-N6)-dimethyltransferase